MVKPYIPDRGDVVWLEFEPQVGKEINKKRPALTLSPKEYNKVVKLALFMPITSQIKGYPFEEKIEVKKISGVVLCDQIRSLDWVARKAKYISTIDKAQIADVIAKLKVLLY